ncbi:class I SAM-dependent methyltransferase [Paenibacillus sp. FSL W7-1287]|uniref:class I SAM-dependent methyltransferase n=1 Tax=Paenibacillus sp. FSL W7-1287 TaxID=2954538 RepID=UPI0030FB9393
MKQNLYDDPQFFNMYKTLRDSKITYNDFIEQPAMRRLLPEVEGLTIADLGCGFGDLALYLVENGAQQVVGVDLSENMLQHAKKHERIQYVRSSMEDIEFEHNQFDLIVSSLAFHYVEDFEALIQRITKWMKPNGYLVFSTEHPVILAHKSQSGWIRDANEQPLYWPMDNYGEEGERSQFWGIDGVIKYHRKLSTLVNTLIRHGLVIQEIDEPEATKEGLVKMPRMVNERKRPSFIVIKAKRMVTEQ